MPLLLLLPILLCARVIELLCWTLLTACAPAARAVRCLHVRWCSKNSALHGRIPALCVPAPDSGGCVFAGSCLVGGGKWI